MRKPRLCGGNNLSKLTEPLGDEDSIATPWSLGQFTEPQCPGEAGPDSTCPTTEHSADPADLSVCESECVHVSVREGVCVREL